MRLTHARSRSACGPSGQTLTGASATFDFVLAIDNADRGFWKTNAAAFHKFCEGLRAPVAYNGTNVPACVPAQLNADDLKLSYQASKSAGNSNALYSAWSVLSTLLTQTGSWSNIVTSVHP